MKYYYDSEFLDDGKTIELISIGIVSDDGREYYAVNCEMPVDRIAKHPWLLRNVVPSLPVLRAKRTLSDVLESFTYGKDFSFALDTNFACVKPRWVIANEVREFLLAGESEPELWAYYGAYDHVVYAQLWGPMIDLPAGLPKRTNDIMQEAKRQGRIDQLPKQTKGLHNALEDARHVKIMHDWLQERQS